MDPNDFLIGIRYNLAMEQVEAKRIWGKLGNTLFRGSRTQSAVEALLKNGGMPACGVTESVFVKGMRACVGDMCTTSELLFVFSGLSKNDRAAEVPLAAVSEALARGMGRPAGPLLDPQALLQRLAAVLYDPQSPVGGRIGLNRILARGDKNFDGAINRREFERIKSFAPFNDMELDVLFNHLDRRGSGTIQFDDLVSSYHLRDHLLVTDRDLQAINEIAVRHIRHRSPGGPGMQRTYQRYLQQTFERHDPRGTGYFRLPQFYRAMEDLAGGDMKELEIEMLFEHWARDGRVDWHEFLKGLLKQPGVAEAAPGSRSSPRSPQDVQELRERLAVALCDRDRQTSGPRGLLRIERLFDRCTASNTGRLSLLEFRRALQGLPSRDPLEADDVDAVFHSFHPDASGAIQYAEFIAAMQRILVERARPSLEEEAEQRRRASEEVATLEEALAEGAVHRRLGAQGLLSAFGKYDRDGDGHVDLRALTAVVRAVCTPIPSEAAIARFFAHHDPEHRGRVAYAPLVAGLGIERRYHLTEAESRAVFTRLAGVSLKCTQSGNATNDGLRRLFHKYDRSCPGHLNLSEFLKAMRSLGYDGPAMDVEYAFRYFDTAPGITFAQFLATIRGTALHHTPGLEELLRRLHADVYGGRTHGAISVARALNRQDACRAGVVDLKGFKLALRGLGATLSDAELGLLFREVQGGRAGGALPIRDFWERLRLAVIEPTDPEQLRRLLNILGTSVEFRNQGLGGWASRFEALDTGRSGRVDFPAYVKAVDIVESNKLSDFEKECLFNHYSSDRMSIDYREFVHDVLYGPLNRARDPLVDPLSQAPELHRREGWLRDAAVVRPPPELVADPTVLQRFLRPLYLPEREGLGSLRLASYLNACCKGGHFLQRRDFLAAVAGLPRAEGGASEVEAAALFEQLREGDRGVAVAALLEAARTSHGVRLSGAQRELLIGRLQDQMWQSGKRDVEATYAIFKSDVRKDGRLDLHSFTSCMRRAAGGVVSDLELELLFNEFADHSKAINVEAFARAIVPPGKPVLPPAPGPSSASLNHTVGKLGAHIYSDQRQPSGTLDLLKSIRRADRDRDDRLSRQEFLEAIQAVGGARVTTSAELNALFEELCEGRGASATVSVPVLVRRLRETQPARQLSGAEFQALLYTVRQALPYAPGDIAPVRMFERHDPQRTRRLALGPFTTALLAMINKDCPLTDLQIEWIFDVLDKDGSGAVNYMDFLDAIASLPPRPSAAASSPPRVLDAYRRGDLQPNQVRSTVALRPPPPAEVPPEASPFRSSTNVLYVGQPGMQNWHKVAGAAPTAVAGGAPSPAARDAQHPRHGRHWVPAAKTLTDWGESGNPRGNANPEAQRYGLYIPGAGADTVAEVSDETALPPYLSVATSIEEWLGMLGLEKYTPLLKANDVDLANVSKLNEEDLLDMGLPMGPRCKILKAARLMH